MTISAELSWNLWTPKTKCCRKIKIHIEDFTIINRGFNIYKTLETLHGIICLEHLDKAEVSF
jgi:hypothetical protein